MANEQVEEKKRAQLKVKVAAKRAKKAEKKTAKKPTRPSTVKKQNVRVKSVEDRLLWKLVGVLLLAVAGFSAVALGSFNWECVGALTKQVQPQTNLVGVIGNSFAYGGYVVFGLAIWCLPIALVIGGLKLLEPIPKEVDEIPNGKVWLRVSGLVLMTLSLAGLFQLMGHWSWVQQILAAIHVGPNAGGWIGWLVMTNGLERGVAAFGSAFLALGLLAASLCMALGLKTVRNLFDWHISEWDWSWLGETAEAAQEGAKIVKEKIEKAVPPRDEEPIVVKRKPPVALAPKRNYPVNAELPPLSLLDPRHEKTKDAGNSEEMGRVIMEKLREFKVNASLVNIVEGPTVTQFALKPGHGVRVDKIASLADDLQLALKAKSLRIFAPIPGEEAVGVQVSNANPQIVYFREIIESEKWQEVATWPKNGKPKYPIPLLLGKNVSGEAVVADLTKMPHLLVAGATNKGKSVCLNSIINGLLMTRTPEQLRMILVDPKKVEFTIYKAMPHLLVPIVDENKRVLGAFKWAAKEMESRLAKFSQSGARNIVEFNETSKDKISYIVIVIDELGDIMTQCGRDVEPVLERLMALARATGIHLIIATQRPDVKTISGTIKANIPGRVALGTANATDSRTILDAAGAEKLCAKGDMLYKSDDGLIRTQGSLITKGELERIMAFVVKQWPSQIDESIVDAMEAEGEDQGEGQSGGVGEDGITDEEYHRAYDIVVEANRASASMLQQRMGIGYNHASRIMHLFEKRGVIGPARGAGPREVLVNS